MVDQTADPVRTLCVSAVAFTRRWGIPVGDDWGVLPNGSCQCPIGQNCRSPGKHPARSRPRERATLDPERAQRWARRGRNLAAYPDDRHVVLDVECRSGRDGLTPLRRWAELTGIDPDALLRTLIVRTGGGGFHAWYWLPPEWRLHPPRGMTGWLPDVDVKTSIKASDKATLPGSRHWTGGVYTFELLPDGGIPDPVCAPEPLLRALAQGRRWVPLAAEDAPVLDASGAVRFADVVEWSTPWRWARILRPDEPSPPSAADSAWFSSGDLPDTSGWGIPPDDDDESTP